MTSVSASGHATAPQVFLSCGFMLARQYWGPDLGPAWQYIAVPQGIRSFLVHPSHGHIRMRFARGIPQALPHEMMIGLERLPPGIVIDGVLHIPAPTIKRGRRRKTPDAEDHWSFVALDLLSLRDADLRRLFALDQRMALLDEALANCDVLERAKELSYTDAFAIAKTKGRAKPTVLARNRASLYTEGLSDDWLEITPHLRTPLTSKFAAPYVGRDWEHDLEKGRGRAEPPPPIRELMPLLLESMGEGSGR